MASLPVSPAKSPSSASASEFTPPSASSGLFCSQVLDSGFPCGRPTQHGHPNRCTRHAGGRGEGPTVYALGAQPQLAAVKAPVVPQGADPRVPGTLGAPESSAGGPGNRGVPATPGGPRFLGVPELDVGSPDFRGAPAPTLAAAEFQRGEAEHGAGDFPDIAEFPQQLPEIPVFAEFPRPETPGHSSSPAGSPTTSTNLLAA